MTGEYPNQSLALPSQFAFQSITKAVAQLYEKYPYPHYPLLARPRWVDGYLASSLFSHSLASSLTGKIPDLRGTAGVNNQKMRVLLAGSGEILPYIVRKWEPWPHLLTCVDLSRKSLTRARIRLVLDKKPIQWVVGDLDTILEKKFHQAASASFGHIDAFGVIHHMPNPGQTLDLFAKSLVPGGTARIMVYNSDARQWIREFQRIFSCLEVDASQPSDLDFARALLVKASQWSPTIKGLLGQMGAQTLSRDARFADTFLHPRECTYDCTWWFSRIQGAGLEVMGLLDRYGELDDLPNPLWQPPSSQALKVRALDRRFEGNLEIFVRRPGGLRVQDHRPSPHSLTFLHYTHALRYGPPAFWFEFHETKNIPIQRRWSLWRAYLRAVFYPHQAHAMPPLTGLDRSAMQRLARLGAILPSQLPERNQRDVLLAPLAKDMEAPARHDVPSAVPDELLKMLAQRLQKQGRFYDRRLKALEARLLRAGRT